MHGGFQSRAGKIRLTSGSAAATSLELMTGVGGPADQLGLKIRPGVLTTPGIIWKGAYSLTLIPASLISFAHHGSSDLGVFATTSMPAFPRRLRTSFAVRARTVS